jgi:murein DD-endopeptidase MepM/ murein hydrolase activator NlpD
MHARLRPVALSWLLCLPAMTVGEEPPVRLDVRQQPASAEIVAYNDGVVPVTVRLELTLEENLEVDRPLPVAVTVAPESEQTILVVGQLDPELPWRFRYRWTWAEGGLDPSPPEPPRSQPASRADYSLPYAPGFAFQVGDRLDDDPSHGGDHAVDWLTPAGTPVFAARGGTVAELPSTPDDCLRILHVDGSIGCYRGLQTVRVRFGDPVQTGHALGSVAAPARPFGTAHLHFDVSLAAVDGGTRQLPLTFATNRGSGVELEPGGVYMRPHENDRGAGDSWPLNAVRSVVTCRTVDRNGHPLDRASRFGSEEVVHVHVAFGAPDVYPIRIEFLQEGRNAPRSIRRFPTKPEWDGVHVTLDLGGVDEPQGDWIVETRVGERVYARTGFVVED